MSATSTLKISIVTPAFRSAHLIANTINSVLGQSYPNLEYMVLDGAGDNTADVLRLYDDQLTYWRSSPDEGQYASINEGFERATGEIMGWINSDDMLLPKSLFTIGEIFSAFPEVEWISTLRPGFWDANGTLYDIRRTPGFSRDAFLDGLYLPGTLSRGHWIQQESTFFRRSLWEKIGEKIPDYNLAADFALWSEFYKHADLYGVDHPLAGFRTIAGQRSEDLSRYVAEGSCALAGLRDHMRWSPNKRRRLCYVKPMRAPKLRSATTAYLGYHGKRIYNANVNIPGNNWRKEDYKFIP